MNNDFAFYATGVDNFGPLFAKSIFARDNSTLFKVWVTLYTCAGTSGLMLDVVPHIDSALFIDNGRNFVSNETVDFVNGLGVDWRLNMPLAPWHGGFF